MSIELHDGKITGSSGVAKAGLTLGIIGTGLAALGGGVNLGGVLGNLGGGRAAAVAEAEQSTIARLESDIAQLKSMRYTDYVGIDLYKNIVATAKEEDAKISAVQGNLLDYIIRLDREIAVNQKETELNRAYDNMARDYQMTILNNKIDCCCEKAQMQACFDKELGAISDSSIISYVNSNFVPGVLKLPAASICPQPTTTA